MMYRFIFFALAVAMALPCAASAQPAKSLNVTIYNSDLGVIREVRAIDIAKGISEVEITDVAQQIEPTSVVMKFSGEVLEQNYRYDLAGMAKILEKYIDRKVTLIGESIIEGELLSVSNGQIVVRTENGGLVMLPDYSKYRISVDKLPADFVTRPTLVWMVESPKAGRQDVEIAYQTSGMSWNAQYNLVLSEDDSHADIMAWVSIDNNSGAEYRDARLKLVAGDISRAMGAFHADIGYGNELARSSRKQFSQKDFFEYHLYDLDRPATLKNNEIKQISLFEAEGVRVNKNYYFHAGSPSEDQHARVRLEFMNSADNNLGMPLPAGVMRAFKSDGEAIQLVGETNIPHTPHSEIVGFEIGEAFDVMIDMIAADYTRIADRVEEYTYDVKIRNRKSDDITVRVVVPTGRNRKILESNYDYEKPEAFEAIFEVPVGANEEKTLRYRIRNSN